MTVRFRCNACGMLIGMEGANVPFLCPVCYERPLGPSKAQARAARWKAEAKRLRKVIGALKTLFYAMELHESNRTRDMRELIRAMKAQTRRKP